MSTTKFKIIDYIESDVVTETKDMLSLVMDQVILKTTPEELKEIVDHFNTTYKERMIN